MDLFKKIQNTIVSHKLLAKGERILVGVSGGPDSVFLLYALYYLRYELGINLYVAHLNHGLRKSAKQDERFVSRLAKKLNLSVTTKKINIKKKQEKGSLEEIARQARFHFLIQVAKKQRCTKIALGHTKDDLAETVLMRIMRGSGLYGLRAILPKRQIHGFTFIRPLLNVSRKELESVLKKRRILYRQDPSNKSLDFFRNKIRLQLLPLLEKKYNKDIKSVLANLAQNITTDYDFLENKACEFLNTITQKQKTKKNIRLNLSELKKLHLSLQRIIMRMAIERLKGNTRKLTFAHLEEIKDLITNRSPGAEVHLPHNVVITKKEGTLNLRVRKS